MISQSVINLSQLARQSTAVRKPSASHLDIIIDAHSLGIKSLLSRKCSPPLGFGSNGVRDRIVDETGAGTGKGFGSVPPGVDMTTAAGLDHGQDGHVSGAAFFVARAETGPAGDDGDGQGALGPVIHGRKVPVADEGDDGRPVIQDFAAERRDFLGFVVAEERACAFQPDLARVQDGMSLILGDGVDHPPQFPDQPVAEAYSIGGRVAGQIQTVEDQMSQAALPALIVAVSAAAIGDQPADNGVAEQIVDSLMTTAADVENHGGRRQCGPEPAVGDALGPRPLIGTDDTGSAHLIEQGLGNRLGGDPDLADAAVDRGGQGRYPELGQQKLADFPPELVVDRQRGGERGQRRGDQTALGQMQLPFVSVERRQGAGGRMSNDLMAAGAQHYLIAIPNAGEPGAASYPFKFQHQKGRGVADLLVPQLEWRAVSGTARRPVALGSLRFPWRVPPFTLGAALLSGFAAGRRGWFPGGSRRCRAPDAGGDTHAARTAGSASTVSERRIRGGRSRAVGRIHRRTIRLFQRDRVKGASQLDKLIMILRLKHGAVHAGNLKLVFRFDTPTDSQIPRLGKSPSLWKARARQFATTDPAGCRRLRLTITTRREPLRPVLLGGASGRARCRPLARVRTIMRRSFEYLYSVSRQCNIPGVPWTSHSKGTVCLLEQSRVMAEEPRELLSMLVLDPTRWTPSHLLTALETCVCQSDIANSPEELSKVISEKIDKEPPDIKHRFGECIYRSLTALVDSNIGNLAVLESLCRVAVSLRIRKAIGPIGQIISQTSSDSFNSDRPGSVSQHSDGIIGIIVSALMKFRQEAADFELNRFWRSEICTLNWRIRIAQLMINPDFRKLGEVVDYLFSLEHRMSETDEVEVVRGLAAVPLEILANGFYTLSFYDDGTSSADRFFNSIFCSTTSPLRLHWSPPARGDKRGFWCISRKNHGTTTPVNSEDKMVILRHTHFSAEDNLDKAYDFYLKELMGSSFPNI